MHPDDRYTFDQVEKLVGLQEEWWDNDGERNVTVVDLLSWARDPTGNNAGYRKAVLEGEDDAWMARRGIEPHSELACILWDFMRGLKDLPLFYQGAIALRAFGFNETEIAALIDPNGVLDQQVVKLSGAQRRALDARRKRVERALVGRPKRDAKDRPVREPAICAKCKNEDPSLDRCGHGAVVYTGGAAAKQLTRAMNGDRLANAS